MVLFGSGAFLANGGEISKIRGASTSQTTYAGKPDGAGFPFIGTYPMNKGPTPLLEGSQGQTAMGFEQNSEHGTPEGQQIVPMIMKLFKPNLKDNSLFEGVMIFLCDTATAQSTRRLMQLSFPLWRVNYELERSARDNMFLHSERKHVLMPTRTADGVSGASHRGKDLQCLACDRITAQHERNYDASTMHKQGAGRLDVFTENFLFAGIFRKGDLDAPKKRVLANLTQQNRSVAPNLWGDVKIGDRVGFVLRWVEPCFYEAFYLDDGSIGDKPTACKMLQLVPYVCKNGGRAPYDFSRTLSDPIEGARDPYDDDLCSRVPASILQHCSRIDADGNVLEERDTSKKPAVYDYNRLDFGLPIFVGTVEAVAKVPPAELRQKALRSPDAYKALLSADYKLDVLVNIAMGA